MRSSGSLDGTFGPRSADAGVPAPVPSVRVLGPPHLTAAHGSAGLRQRKHWAALGYLLTTPEGASRTHLATLLWPDNDAPKARTNLRVTLTTLRRALGEVLVSDRTHVRLDGDAVDADVLRLRGWGAAGARYDDAPTDLDPTRALLEGIDLTDAPAFMDWLADARTHLAYELHDAWTRAAADAEADGSADDAIHLADVASRIAPWDEATHRTAIRLRRDAGRPTDAVRRYLDAEDALRRHLDADPSHATVELLHDVRRRWLADGAHRPAASAVAPDAVGDERLATPFGLIGREADVLAVLDRLADPGVPWLTLAAGPGLGTSTLASEALRLHVARTGERVTRLVVRDAPHGDAVARAVDTALAPAGWHAPTFVWLDDLPPGRVTPDAAEALTARHPGVRFVATGRAPIGHAYERTWTPGPLGLPDLDVRDPERMTDAPATELFLASARKHGWTGSPADLDPKVRTSVALTARILQGHPLSLVLAGYAWARGTLGDPFTTLPDLAGRLTAGAPDLPPHQRSLLAHGRAAAAAVPRDLAPFLRRLAYVGVPAPPGVLAHAEARDADAVAADLARLEALGLVTRSGGAGRPATYRVPAGLRAALRADVDRQDEADAAFARRYRDDVFDRLTRVADALQGPGEAEALADAVTWIDDANALLREHIAVDPRAALALGARTWRVYERLGQGPFAERFLRATADAHAHALPTPERAGVATALGGLAMDAGRPGDARHDFAAALAARREADDEPGVARALMNLAAADGARGAPADALEDLEEAARHARHAGDPWLVAACETNRGHILSETRDDAGACAAYARAAAAFHEAGDAIGEASAHLGHARACLARGAIPELSETMSKLEATLTRYGTPHGLGVLRSALTGLRDALLADERTNLADRVGRLVATHLPRPDAVR